MGTTPAFGLRYPEPTDKVTDGALAIRNLAEDVDADLGAEVTRAEAAYVAKALADAKGDLLAASGADALARLPVGADGQVLTADAAAVLGVKWAPAAGGTDLTKIASTTLAAAAATIAFTAIPATFRDLLLVLTARSTTGSLLQDIQVKPAAPATSVTVDQQKVHFAATAATVAENLNTTGGSAGSVPAASAPAGLFAQVQVLVPLYSVSGQERSTLVSYGHKYGTASGNLRIGQVHNWYRGLTAVVDAITLSAGNFEVGTTATLYGLK